MRISLFSGSSAHQMTTVDQVVDLPLEKLGDSITSSSWSPFLFNNREGTDRPYRQSKLFKETDLLVFDIDEHLPLAKAIELCRAQAVLIGTTKSHQLEKVSGITMKPPVDRYRVIMVLERTITDPDEYRATWMLESQKLGFVDAQCKDLARFYFPCVEVVFCNPVGKVTPVQAKRSPDPTPAPQPQVDEDLTSRLRPPASHNRGKLFKTTLEFIEYGASSNWHTQLFKAAMDIKEQGYSEAEAEDLLANATKTFKGYLDEHDLGVINDVYRNREGKYSCRSGVPPDNKRIGSFQPPTTEHLRNAYQREADARRRSKLKALPFLDSVFDAYFKIDYGLTLIGAKTGKGKSTTCQNVIAEILLRERCQQKILLISNEETLAEIYSKLACLMLELNWKTDYRSGTCDVTVELVDQTAKNLMEYVTVLTARDGHYDPADLDSLKSIMDYAKDNKDFSVVLLDYFQTVSRSSERPFLERYAVLKDLGDYLKRYAMICEVPVIVFVQLYAESADRKEFGDRIQYDKTLVNHAQTCLEIDADCEALITTIKCHKQRWGQYQNWKIELQFLYGRLRAPYRPKPEANSKGASNGAK